MRHYFFGIILNFQFFTIIPIQREIPMTDKNMNGLIRTLPLFGFILGVIYSGITYLLATGTPLSSLMISFIIWLLAIILTGAIHLDGWIDASDAFFSYRDREKRIKIMTDPQVGAFGVISVIVLLAIKFLFIFEIVLNLEMYSYILILFIPFFSRMLTGMMLILVPPAKKEGLGYFFQQAVKKGTLRFYVVYFIPVILFLGVWSRMHLWMVLLMFLFTVLFYLLLKRKVTQWFGGMTGDVVGASQEGMEVFLWMIVWVLHSFVMG